MSAEVIARDGETMAVGVVVPNKNGAAFLCDALTSIVTQDYPDIQCVVMDAESTDGSVDIVRAFGHRITWFSEPDTCAAEAINRGWKLLEAPILTWLNSDDMWAPGAVSRVVETFSAHPDADVVSGECPMIDEEGSLVGFRPTGPFDLLRSLGRADHILNQPAVFMKRSALQRAGWLREIWLHDHDLWLRLALTSVFVHIDDVLAFGRERRGNLGQDAKLVGRMRVKVIKDFLARPDLPEAATGLKRRSMSWAHIRGAQAYLYGRQGVMRGLLHVAQALAWDPLNAEALRVVSRRGREGIRRSIRRMMGLSDV